MSKDLGLQSLRCCQKATLLQRAIAATVDQLQRLNDEFGVANAAWAAFDIQAMGAAGLLGDELA